MNCNRGCPYSGQGYSGPPWPWPNDMRGLQVSQPRQDEDILAYARRIKREITEFEKEFKGEVKKEDKKTSLSYLETVGLLMLAGIIQMSLLQYFMR